MTIDKIPQPDSEGGGGGGGGISDVTGTEPIVVTSPSSTTRNVAINPGIPGTFSVFPAGTIASLGRRRVGWTSVSHGTQQSFAQVQNNTGTVTFPTITATSLFSSASHAIYTSTASVDVRVGVAWTQNEIFRGNVDMTGGVILELNFGFITGTSTSRFFCGLTPTSTLPTLATDPSNLTDCVGIAFDSADTNFQVMHNDSAGTCTKVDLGANFPKPTGAALSRDVYYMMIYCPPNSGGTAGNFQYYLLRRDDLTKVTSGTITTNQPTASTLLYQSWAYGTGPSSAVAVAAAFMRMQSETTL